LHAYPVRIFAEVYQHLIEETPMSIASAWSEVVATA
jgi:hypothetical protein